MPYDDIGTGGYALGGFFQGVMNTLNGYFGQKIQAGLNQQSADQSQERYKKLLQFQNQLEKQNKFKVSAKGIAALNPTLGTALKNAGIDDNAMLDPDDIEKFKNLAPDKAGKEPGFSSKTGMPVSAIPALHPNDEEAIKVAQTLQQQGVNYIPTGTYEDWAKNRATSKQTILDLYKAAHGTDGFTKPDPVNPRKRVPMTEDDIAQGYQDFSDNINTMKGGKNISTQTDLNALTAKAIDLQQKAEAQGASTAEATNRVAQVFRKAGYSKAAFQKILIQSVALQANAKVAAQQKQQQQPQLATMPGGQGMPQRPPQPQSVAQPTNSYGNPLANNPIPEQENQ